MKHDEFRWATVDREDLLDVLLGEHEPPSLGSRMLSEWELRGAKIAVGYRDTRSRRSYSPPSLIVIPDDSAPETLSWIRTFASEASPLSQYGRVILASEWHQFETLRGAFDFGEQRSDRWASIAVGEALSQMEGETNLQNLPLSRFAGCFSTPIARASLVWGHDEATRICADRLRLLESDRRFARRSVGVEQLLPVWSIAGSRIYEHLSASEAATLVLEAAVNHLGARDLKSFDLVSSIQDREFPGLFSDSVEERVGAFNRLTTDILHQAQLVRSAAQSAMASVVLAAAAFLVGRGTSHVFLLQRAQRLAPTAAAWFGTIAALAGPRAWDKAWLTAVKGAERLLRPEFSWLEMPSADICWSEFAWLAGAFDGSDVFLDLPKMLPRTLNIEIIPGATCQFRLAGESAESESKQTPEPTARERELLEAVGQFILLAKRIDGKIERTFDISSRPQHQPQKMERDVSSRRTQRTMKPKKDSGER
ncbi:hypothetical protein LQD23_06860 [Chromobacterium violaceum]|uniref:hypothetical protein n=1 Tax=Chromobacterium violaceum TaxID=536 RepID=UPI001E3FF0B3|nr:hypothetical protein [Chromobacterium violaceum]MCD0492014.1 hypothetical protein [Chromobacterium violaceum]